MKIRTMMSAMGIVAAVAGMANAACAATMGSVDRTFAKKAAQGGMAEVQAARIALQRGIDGGVRTFAQRMYDDHTRANRELQRVAMRQGIALPAHTDLSHQMALERLSSLSGSRFDKVYINDQVKDHVATVALFRREAEFGRNTALRQFAAKTLPTLQSHTRMSYQVAANLMPPRAGLYAHRKTNMHPMGRM
jgi:putative membrane protein